LSSLYIDSTGNQAALSGGSQHVGMEIQSKLIPYQGYTYFFASKNVDAEYTASGIVAGSADPTENDPEYQVNRPVRTLFLVKTLLNTNLDFKSEIIGQYEVDENVFVQSDYASGLTNCHVQDDVFYRPSAVVTTLQPAGASRVLASVKRRTILM
jgi:hypothetical protein